MNNSEKHLHLVSDATGETIHAVARAGLVQFANATVQQHVWNLIRTPRQLELVQAGLRQHPGLVLYTFVDENLRQQLVQFCAAAGLPALAVLDPVINALGDYLGATASHQPGRQHTMDEAYFARIAAMDFALAQDDGQRTQNLAKADVVVLGVSRTSKTPTCLYLANKGIAAANIPLVPGVELPALLFNPPPHLLVVGLTTDANRLAEVRTQRLKVLGTAQTGYADSYADTEQVAEELRQARRLYSQLNIPVIDVTRRSIEETAAEIITLLTARRAAATARA